MTRRGINVLGIESSCDDTGVAIINSNGKVLSNCIHSQLKQHLDNGGIIPVVAKEYHLNNIDRVANQAFRESNLSSISEDIDAIAVSTRPGLSFSLQVGLNYARTLAKKYKKPLIPIHHMQAHALMPLLQNKTIRFPYLALLISGGHCILSIAKRYNEFHILGNTIDEAPGDLLDKTARRLKLKRLGPPFDNISGGAAIELLSNQEGADRFKYFNNITAIPMLRYPNCDFSFSGYRGNLELLIPHVDNLWDLSDRNLLMKELGDICASLQRSILLQLVKKLQRALSFYRMNWCYDNPDAFASDINSKHLGYKLQKIDDEHRSVDMVISGGVGANSYFVSGIRKACQEAMVEEDCRVFAPTKDLCSDNGLMIAWNGLLRYQDFHECKYDPNKWDQINNSLVFEPDRLDSINVEADSPMGQDISDRLKALKIKISKLSLPEFKLN